MEEVLRLIKRVYFFDSPGITFVTHKMTFESLSHLCNFSVVESSLKSFSEIDGQIETVGIENGESVVSFVGDVYQVINWLKSTPNKVNHSFKLMYRATICRRPNQSLETVGLLMMDSLSQELQYSHYWHTETGEAIFLFPQKIAGNSAFIKSDSSDPSYMVGLSSFHAAQVLKSSFDKTGVKEKQFTQNNARSAAPSKLENPVTSINALSAILGLVNGTGVSSSKDQKIELKISKSNKSLNSAASIISSVAITNSELCHSQSKPVILNQVAENFIKASLLQSEIWRSFLDEWEWVRDFSFLREIGLDKLVWKLSHV